MGTGEKTGALTLALRAFPIAILALIGSCSLHDRVVPIPRQFATRAGVFAIQQYRAHISGRMSRFVQCRFRPSCSAYGLAAVEKYGAYRGGAKALWRIARCNPLTPAGTIDPP